MLSYFRSLLPYAKIWAKRTTNIAQPRFMFNATAADKSFCNVAFATPAPNVNPRVYVRAQHVFALLSRFLQGHRRRSLFAEGRHRHIKFEAHFIFALGFRVFE